VAASGQQVIAGDGGCEMMRVVEHGTARSREATEVSRRDRPSTGLCRSHAQRKWVEASDGHHEAYDLVRDPGEESNLFVPGQGVPPGFEPLAEALASRRVSLALATTRP
jgi:hypothetical protein